MVGVLKCLVFVRISLDFIPGFDKVSLWWMRYNADNELSERCLVMKR